jgi:uncharacterized membrane protein
VEPETAAERSRSRDLDRFLTFVDAVVAIAITLLVLPLVDVTGELGKGDSVAQLLSDHLPQLYGFLLSFAVIAQLWFSQHHVVSSLVEQDPLVSRLLVLWLLTIVVLPFPTALVARAGGQPTTKIFYIGTMAVSAVCLALISRRIAARREIRDSDQAPDPTTAVVTALVFGLALALTLLLPATGYYVLLLLLLTDVLSASWRRFRSHRRTGTRVGR